MDFYEYKDFSTNSHSKNCFIYIAVLVFLFVCNAGPVLAESSQPNPMGKPYVSMLNDLRAISWNPATIASIETNQIAVMSTAWESTRRPFEAKYIGYAQPIREKYAVAFGGEILYAPGSDKEHPSTENDHIMGAGAIQLPRNFYVGGSVGWLISNRYAIQDSFFDNPVMLILGLGGLWSLKDFFTLGSSFNWEGKTISDIPSPGSSYKLGFTLTPPKIRTALGGSVSFPMLKDKAEGFLLDTSLEGGPIPVWIGLLSIRLGYTRKYKYGGNAFHKLRWISSGGTLKIQSFQVDYDFIPFFGDGNTHRISILYKFPDRWPEIIKNSPSTKEIEEAAYKLAEYYYNNGQYYESINSCQDVLQHGDEYPSAKDARAYILLAKNYLELSESSSNSNIKRELLKEAQNALIDEHFTSFKEYNKYKDSLQEKDRIMKKIELKLTTLN